MEKLFRAGRPVMWPLLASSAMFLAAIAERYIFWIALLRRESEAGHQIIVAAREDLPQVPRSPKYLYTPIGRFLYEPFVILTG
jgi:biopolymer transport protein ExbB/TolQ